MSKIKVITTPLEQKDCFIVREVYIDDMRLEDVRNVRVKLNPGSFAEVEITLLGLVEFVEIKELFKKEEI